MLLFLISLSLLELNCSDSSKSFLIRLDKRKDSNLLKENYLPRISITASFLLTKFVASHL